MAESLENFRTLVHTYKDMVYNLSLGFTGDRELANDISQEIFIKIFQKVNSFRNDSKVKTWIYRITVNTNLEFMRKNKNYLRVIENNSDIKNNEFEFDHPGIKLENKELANILFQAVNKLPDLQKTAFTLSKIEGLSNADIASILKKSKSSVESLMHRANQNLKVFLKDYYHEYKE